MYRNYIYNDISEALPDLMRELLQNGDEVGSRLGERTLEMTHVGTTLLHPWRREILVPDRGANLAAQIAETMWVLAGRNDVEFLQHYLPRAKDFADDGEHWRGGYGPRLREWDPLPLGSRTAGQTPPIDQLAEVVRLLSEGVGTRRAVMNIFDPGSDFGDSKDIPCNNWLSFISRLGKLDLHVAIRSNDLMWGWSGINAFEWSALQEIVAGLLGLEVGGLHFSTTSLHLYDRHWAKATKIGHTPNVRDRSLSDSPRFEAKWRDGLEGFDYLVREWFHLEETIRTSKDTSMFSSLDSHIHDFPEPMMRSWLRVLLWWWAGDQAYLAPLEGTRLHAAALMSAQPMRTTAVVAPEPSAPWDSDICANCGSARSNHGPGGSRYPCAFQMKEASEPSAFITAATALHCEKHEAYGDSWKRRGEMLGILANIARKIDRLGGAETADETSADTAMDLMVYLAKYETWLMDNGEETIGRGNHFSDDPHTANQILFGIDDEWEWSKFLNYDLGMIETGLREGFNQLEGRVTAQDEGGKLNLVHLMQRDAYRLARTLWEREQAPAVRNATRSWSPDSYSDDVE